MVEEGPRRQHLVVSLKPLDGRLRVAVHNTRQVYAVAQRRQRLRSLHPHLRLDCVDETRRKMTHKFIDVQLIHTKGAEERKIDYKELHTPTDHIRLMVTRNCEVV